MNKRAITIEQARAAKEKAKDLLAGVAAVSGIGISRLRDEYAVKVNLAFDMDRTGLPTTIDGVPALFQVVGRVHEQ